LAQKSSYISLGYHNQSAQVHLLAKSEILEGVAVVCGAAGGNPLGGSGGMLPQEILENGSS